MNIEWLKHFLVTLTVGALAAIVNCVSRRHGFSMDCIYAGVGFVGAAMAIYLRGLSQPWPGHVMLPTMPGSNAAAQAAARTAESTARKVNAKGAGDSGLDF
jgi:uncharacterized membrane protein YeaQ/YmgE (transglycosylase-associated protein family)